MSVKPPPTPPPPALLLRTLTSDEKLFNCLPSSDIDKVTSVGTAEPDLANEFKADETILYRTALPNVPHFIPVAASLRDFLMYAPINRNASMEQNVPSHDIKKARPIHQTNPMKLTLQ